MFFEIRAVKEPLWDDPEPWAVRIKPVGRKGGHWLYTTSLRKRYRRVPVPESP